MPLSTIKAITKKFRSTGTVANLLSRGQKFIFPTHTVRKMVRQSSRITIDELQKKVAFWGHKVSKTTIKCHCHASRLCVRHAGKKPFLSCNHKRKHPEFAKWDWNHVLRSDETKMGNRHSRRVWCKRKDDHTEKILIPTVKYGGESMMLCGCFFLRRPWEPR